ncbi:MAG: rRNA pseudouridine synthase [Planctomycetes bacterium]|nr:rRNA pseudouridine synthase [Planctomycetota bacterium]
MAKQRLHKFLASSGIGSRRRCEELIAEGRVSVDGVEVHEMGIVVDPDTQEIRFDDELVRPERPVHFVVNKPVGYLCTSADDWGRRTVISLVKDRHRRRLFTVGRLDEDSEGIIFVTNDGEFANRVAHPRYGLEKTYELKLHGYLEDEQLDRVRQGVWLSTGKSQPMFVRLLKRSQQFSLVRVRIHEGKNRQLRRVFAKIGHAVARLQRVRIGPIELKGLKKGEARRLGKTEVDAILAACEKNRAEGGARALGLRSKASERFAGEKAGPAARRQAAGKKTTGKKKASAKKPARQDEAGPRRGRGRNEGPSKGPARKPAPGSKPGGPARRGSKPSGRSSKPGGPGRRKPN